MCESGLLFSETEEILEGAAAACLSNNYFSVCHWELRRAAASSGKSLRYLVILNKEGWDETGKKRNKEKKQTILKSKNFTRAAHPFPTP